MSWVLVRPYTPKVRGQSGDVPVGHADQKTYDTGSSARAAAKRLAKKGETYWAMEESRARDWDWDDDLPF